MDQEHASCLFGTHPSQPIIIFSNPCSGISQLWIHEKKTVVPNQNISVLWTIEPLTHLWTVSVCLFVGYEIWAAVHLRISGSMYTLIKTNSVDSVALHGLDLVSVAASQNWTVVREDWIKGHADYTEAGKLRMKEGQELRQLVISSKISDHWLT